MSFKPLNIGDTAAFAVIATNKEGHVVPDTSIVVKSDNDAVATATCHTDGSNGVVTAVAIGAYNVTATDGTLTSAAIDGIVADLKPATLTVTPA